MSGKFTQMSVKLHQWMEDSSGRIKTLLPQKHHVEGSFAARVLGKTLLREELWSLKGEALARGLGLGMFIAFTPTVGIQMTLVCIFILLYPGNLPIALAACWLTNPLTAVPVYGTEWYVGKVILEFFGYEAGIPPNFFEYESITDVVNNVIKQGGTLWFGSVISSAFLAVASYWGVMGVVYLERRLRKIKLDDLKRIRRVLRRRKRETANGLEDASRASIEAVLEQNPPGETVNR